MCPRPPVLSLIPGCGSHSQSGFSSAPGLLEECRRDPSATHLPGCAVELRESLAAERVDEPSLDGAMMLVAVGHECEAGQVLAAPCVIAALWV